METSSQRIIVERNAEQFGPYTFDEARAYLEEGRLLHADAATIVGTDKWLSVGTILGVAAPPPPLPAAVSLHSILLPLPNSEPQSAVKVAKVTVKADALATRSKRRVALLCVVLIAASIPVLLFLTVFCINRLQRSFHLFHGDVTGTLAYLPYVIKKDAAMKHGKSEEEAIKLAEWWNPNPERANPDVTPTPTAPASFARPAAHAPYQWSPGSSDALGIKGKGAAQVPPSAGTPAPVVPPTAPWVIPQPGGKQQAAPSPTQETSDGSTDRAEPYLASPGDDNLTRFSVEEYGCSFLVPSKVFSNAPEEGVGPRGSKLLTFFSSDKRAFLRLLILPRRNGTIKDLYKVFTQENQLTPNYEVVKPDWFVVSAGKDGADYYNKSVQGKNFFYEFVFAYPEGACPVSKETLTKMSRDFHGGTK
jgi:hypothetical protein